ncbi:protein FAR1-RELATED SEQUENCE 5-like [Carya illinoinensis]|uniref:protein FAR1-RELATED SEQUENCE 5-like n=1 Tax=Carya illinoinensis TaxID=32201 RepID=UPI001C71BA37|nr:protein FAR1-RELATED SEQUENCE 5-like [Carya illinoinensis]
MDGGDLIEEPKRGMEFDFFEKLMSYYKLYAKKCGFGSMTQRSERDDDGSVKCVTFGCAWERKARNKTMNVAKPRSTGKTNCKARVNALKVERKMWLTTVHNTHNHGLSPQKSCFFRCNRKISETVKRVLDTNNLAGIRMNKSFRSLVVGMGGFENLPFLEKDCRNYIDKARHLRLEVASAGVLRDYFSRMHYKNPGFFYLMDLDDDERYGMPFAPFVGVNRHGQLILLGAGLILNEDTNTFLWLFQTWQQCMDVSEKTGSHRAYKSGLKTQLMKSVYNTQTIEEFEKSWKKLIRAYTLQENIWLQSLYAVCTHWVPIFLNEYFWAGMSTTQQSESMNVFFDEYVHVKTNLKEFVNQFDSALRKKIENEVSANFHSYSITIPCISRSPIEKKIQELYTNAKSREVQKQVMGLVDMDPSLFGRDGVKKIYLIEDEVCVDEFTKHVTYYMDFNEEDCDVKCSCSKEHTEDETKKLYAMIELYGDTRESPSMAKTASMSYVRKMQTTISEWSIQDGARHAKS